MLLACDGPKDRNGKEYNFWKGFVLDHNASLIVNLCGDVGSSRSVYSECSLYWPMNENIPKTLTTFESDDTIKVTLLQTTEINEVLRNYTLNV